MSPGFGVTARLTARLRLPSLLPSLAAGHYLHTISLKGSFYLCIRASKTDRGTGLEPFKTLIPDIISIGTLLSLLFFQEEHTKIMKGVEAY